MLNIWKNKIAILGAILIFTMPLLSTTVSAQKSNTTPSGIAINDLENQIDTFLKKHVGQTIPGAAVVVVKNGEVILQKGYGYADLENQIPVNAATTVFEYGSITKLFVWTSVMQLVEQGKLNLDEDIKMYLPDPIASKLKYKYTITMNNLMSHTAGFEQQSFDWKPLPLDPPDTPLEITLVKHQPKQIYMPGTVIAYSNYGAALAGLVVEQITGKHLYDYQREGIFNPLGMEAITGHPTLADSPQLYDTKSKGYSQQRNGRFKQGIWTYLSEYPAGSANGTIGSLSNYLIGLMPDESTRTPLFSDQSTLTQMLSQSYTPHPEMLSNAHGFWEYDGAQRSLWHSGNTASFTSFFAFVPEERFGFAILTNAAAAIDPTYGLGELLLGESGMNYPGQSIQPSAHDLVGSYMISMYSHSSFLEALHYLTEMVKINVAGENEITVQILGKTQRYVQTSPHYYELIAEESPDMRFFHQQLYVESDASGKIQRISGGHFMDFIPLPQGRTPPYLWLSLLIAITSSLFFIVTPMVLSFRCIRRKNKLAEQSAVVKLQRRVITLLVLVGTIFIVNNGYLLLNAAFNASLVIQQIRLQIILNWILFVAAILLGIYYMYLYKRFKSNSMQKKCTVLVLCMLSLTIALLFNWNFFALL